MTKTNRIATYVKDHAGIGELVHHKAAGLSSADVYHVGARLVAAYREGDGSIASTIDCNALSGFFLSVHVECKPRRAVDRSGIGDVSGNGNRCSRGNL